MEIFKILWGWEWSKVGSSPGSWNYKDKFPPTELDLEEEHF